MKKKNKPVSESSESPTLIGADSSFDGVYKGKESIYIEGDFTGTIEATNNVYIHEGARINANVHAKNVMVHGLVNGNIFSTEEINIGPTGQVNGDVETKSLTVATGGCLNGQCRMHLKESALEEREPQGRFGSWKKKEAVQSEPTKEGLVNLETVHTGETSEQETDERSNEL